MIDAKMDGPWDAAGNIIDQLGALIVSEAKITNQQNALILERTIVQHIAKQDLGWKALRPWYKKYKQSKGLSEQVLIATSTFLNSVTTQSISDGMAYFVGVLRAARRKDGEDGVLIAAVHEFGSPAHGIPERPWLRPSFEEKLPEMKERYGKNLMRALRGLVSKGKRAGGKSRK